MLFWLRFLLSALLLTASLSKMAHSAQLEEAIKLSGLMPPSLLPLTAWSVILAEATAGITLLLPGTKTFGALLVLALSSLFMAYSLWRWINRIGVPCSCFGLLFKLSPWQSAGVSLFMAFVALALLARPPVTGGRCSVTASAASAAETLPSEA